MRRKKSGTTAEKQHEKGNKRGEKEEKRGQGTERNIGIDYYSVIIILD